MYSDKSIKEYLDLTASTDPLLPAGGSGAALCASLASALTEFTANISISQGESAEKDVVMEQVSSAAGEFREKFIGYIDEDAEVYTGLLDAYALPQETEDQKQLRRLEISEQTKRVTLVPLKLALDAMDLMEQTRLVQESGNHKASGDAKTADYIIRAVVQASLNNVRINLALLDDPDFTYDVIRSVHDLESKLDREL